MRKNKFGTIIYPSGSDPRWRPIPVNMTQTEIQAMFPIGTIMNPSGTMYMMNKPLWNQIRDEQLVLKIDNYKNYVKERKNRIKVETKKKQEDEKQLKKEIKKLRDQHKIKQNEYDREIRVATRDINKRLKPELDKLEKLITKKTQR